MTESTEHTKRRDARLLRGLLHLIAGGAFTLLALYLYLTGAHPVVVGLVAGVALTTAWRI